MRINIVVLFALMTLLSAVHAQNEFVIEGPLKEDYRLGNILNILEDSTGKLTYETVSGLPVSSFKSNPDSFILNRNTKQHTFWAAVKIKNASGKFFGYKFRNDEVDVFDSIIIFFNDHGKKIIRSLYFDGTLNDMTKDFFLKENGEATLYIKYVTKPGIKKCRFYLTMENELIRRHNVENKARLKGSMMGMLVMAFSFIILLFFSLKERAFLWLGLLQLSLFLLFINLDIFGLSEKLAKVFSDAAASLLLISLAMFTNSFLQLNNHHPKLSKILIYSFVGTGVLWAVEAYGIQHTIPLFERVIEILTLLIFMFLLFVISYAAIRKVPFAGILLVSFTGFLLPFIVLLIQGILDIKDILPDTILFAGTTFQIIIWVAVLNFKIMKLRKKGELHQTQLITSLKENENLIMYQNKILEEKVTQRTRQLQTEKKKSDDLLLNILPSEIAEELKEKGSAEAKLFNPVTVLFTDFVNFTGISETLSPAELVAEINTNFSAFDKIMEKNGLEKIKTIGDAYMAVCGLPKEISNHAERVVNAALEIQSFMQKNEGKFQIRIGIHSGPVVAGIVGIKKYAYDIWGDTVNTANRMESSGETNKINISGATYELVKDKFTCTHRGKIQAKNKGMIDMYFVEKPI